jgi:hypothetical protein
MRWTSSRVGRKADLAQFVEVFDASADGEVAGVVDGGCSAKRLSLLMVLLDAGLLIVDVPRRRHAVGNDTGAEPSRRAAAHLAVEHQAHLAGAADIKVLADHLRDAVARAISDGLAFQAFSAEFITNILETRTRALPEPGPLQRTRRHDLLDIDIAPPDLNAYQVNDHDPE